MTVYELHEQLTQLLAEGYGDAMVVDSDDNELDDIWRGHDDDGDPIMVIR